MEARGAANTNGHGESGMSDKENLPRHGHFLRQLSRRGNRTFPIVYFPFMRLSLTRLMSGLLILAAPACRDGIRPVVYPPSAEFVLSAGDSAYWVTSSKAGVQSKGVPLDLARVDGRFFEIYVVDDDQSFQGADLVGQNVFRRDLRTGDSVLVYRDTIVPHLAREYARLHPRDHRLTPGDEPDADPVWRATATVELGASHGSFMSFSVHTDVERDSAELWHTSRRGVLDLRRNRAASLADVVGGESADIERRRDQALRDALDSVRSEQGERGARAASQLANYRLDPASFELTTVDGAPAIAYAVPGSGSGDAGHMLPLEPIRFAEPTWWRDIAASLPSTSADGSRDVWRRGGYDVVVRYEGEGARLVVRDSTSRDWPVGPIASPAQRVYWLDRPALDSVTRQALVKAFQDAASYGAATRVASGEQADPRWHTVLSARPLPIRFRSCSFSPLTRPIAPSRSCGALSRTSCANIVSGRRRWPSSNSPCLERIPTSLTRGVSSSRRKFAPWRGRSTPSRPR